MAPPAFDTGQPVKLGLNVCWMLFSCLTSLMLFGVFFGDLLFDEEDDSQRPIEEQGIGSGWTDDRLCACNWIDDGKVLDPTCDANNTAKVEAYLVHLGAREVSGAGGFADNQREEVMSTDLPYPKSGYYHKQQICEDCVDGCPLWWMGRGWTNVLGVLIGLCVAGMIACRVLYVVVIVPNERADLVTKVLAADTGMNFYCAIIGGYMMPIIHGIPIYLPPRGPPFIMMCIMGSPMWIGWLTSQKVWTDAGADSDAEKGDSG